MSVVGRDAVLRHGDVFKFSSSIAEGIPTEPQAPAIEMPEIPEAQPVITGLRGWVAARLKTPNPDDY